MESVNNIDSSSVLLNTIEEGKTIIVDAVDGRLKAIESAVQSRLIAIEAGLHARLTNIEAVLQDLAAEAIDGRGLADHQRAPEQSGGEENVDKCPKIKQLLELW